jgi:hypothetical protein
MVPHHNLFIEATNKKKSGLRRGPSLDSGLHDPDWLIEQTMRRRVLGVPRPPSPSLPELLAAGATVRNHTRH